MGVLKLRNRLVSIVLLVIFLVSCATSKAIPWVEFNKLTVISQPNSDSYYPLESKKLGEEGKVVVILLVNEGGRVEIAAPGRNPSPYIALNTAAYELARNFVFKPYEVNGLPTKFFTTVMITFELSKK